MILMISILARKILIFHDSQQNKDKVTLKSLVSMFFSREHSKKTVVQKLERLASQLDAKESTTKRKYSSLRMKDAAMPLSVTQLLFS